MVFFSLNPTIREISVTFSNTFINKSNSLRLPKAVTKGRAHISVSITEGNYFIFFHMLVAAKAKIISTFLRFCLSAITMDYAQIKKFILMKYKYKTHKNVIKASMGFKAPKGSIDT